MENNSKNIILNFYNKEIKDIVSIFNLMIKRYFKSYSTIWTFLFPLIFYVGFMFLFPYHMMTTLLIFFSIMLSIFIEFGLNFYSIRGSVVYDSLKIHKIKNSHIYTSLVIFLFVTSFIIFLYVIGLLFIGAFTNNLRLDISVLGEPSIKNTGFLLDFDVDLLSADWLILIYYFFLLVIILILISFIIQFLTTDVNKFMLTAASLSIIFLLFGGTFGTSVILTPTGHVFLVNDINSEYDYVFYLNSESIVNYDPETNTLYVFPERKAFFEFTGETTNGTLIPYGVVEETPSPIGSGEFDLFYLLSLFNPFYYLNQLIQNAFSSFNIGSNVAVIYDGLGVIDKLSDDVHLEMKYFTTNSSEWMAILLVPYGYILLFIFIIWFSNLFKKNK